MTKLPLDGIRVLDLTRVLAGPWATMSLGDLGATVWKIENIIGGDDTRAWSIPNYKGVSTYYLSANRGKHSIAVDLKSAEGRQIVLDLAAQADVVVENFRAGTVDRLGIGYADLRKLNPGIIYCSISGYGQTGPERDRPGYDFIMQAESGLMSITGPEDGPPSRLGVAFTDVVAGMIATQSILAALYQRRETGVGAEHRRGAAGCDAEPADQRGHGVLERRGGTRALWQRAPHRGALSGVRCVGWDFCLGGWQ